MTSLCNHIQFNQSNAPSSVDKPFGHGQLILDSIRFTTPQLYLSSESMGLDKIYQTANESLKVGIYPADSFVKISNLNGGEYNYGFSAREALFSNANCRIIDASKAGESHIEISLSHQDLDGIHTHYNTIESLFPSMV